MKTKDKETNRRTPVVRNFAAGEDDDAAKIGRVWQTAKCEFSGFAQAKSSEANKIQLK